MPIAQPYPHQNPLTAQGVETGDEGIREAAGPTKDIARHYLTRMGGDETRNNSQKLLSQIDLTKPCPHAMSTNNAEVPRLSRVILLKVKIFWSFRSERWIEATPKQDHATWKKPSVSGIRT